jgi:SAM-dependent methyltransferase
VPFYVARIPRPDAEVLELGCGTGRVLVPLAASCGYIHGLDQSEAFLDRCRQKLAAAGVPAARARAQRADITDFDLGRAFDLVIAPFRVFQALETDTAIEGLFRCVRAHLAPRGTCILNVFNPSQGPKHLPREWRSDVERFNWEVPVPGGKVTRHDRRARLDPERLVLYPELVYRRYVGDSVAETVVVPLVMRCHYPAGFEELIVRHGFSVVQRWGGYAGEPYGAGPELVIQFAA